jgi:hypothetical protein
MRADPRFKPLPPEPVALLEEGHVQAAVRALRRSHGVDLRQAQNWIDSYIDDNPMLRIQLETGQRAARRRFFFWFLLVDAMVTAAIICYVLYFKN